MYFRNNNVIGKISPVADKANFTLLYDYYAGALYAAICRLTDNTFAADEILIETFIKLKGKAMTVRREFLFVSLLRLTQDVAIKYLAQKKIPLKKPDVFVQPYPILSCVLDRNYSLNEAAKLVSISPDKILKKLYDECESIKAPRTVSTESSNGD
ncbi:MAG: hypothetical protein M3040_12065 [Bacteroidota bacterium]|nr:hypothetical protein [Bacteroidota bacterium]